MKTAAGSSCVIEQNQNRILFDCGNLSLELRENQPGKSRQSRANMRLSSRRTEGNLI
jgi:metal-dependent hydrolase (beta-lactamase superfamily II)